MISLYVDDTSRGDSAEHCKDKTTKIMTSCHCDKHPNGLLKMYITT